jgi:transposase
MVKWGEQVQGDSKFWHTASSFSVRGGGMAHKEYNVLEVVDILRRYLAGDSIRGIARSKGMDRNTVRKYIRIAAEQGFSAKFDGDLDEMAYGIFSRVHPEKREETENKRDKILLPHEKTISDWLEKNKLTLTKVHIKLIRKGVDVSYSALWRFARERLGFGGAEITVRMADTKPGEVAEVDFGRLGIIYDPASGRNRVLYALVITLVYSRHQYVYVTHSQDLKSLIGGIEEAWESFEGVVRRLIIDNMKAAVVKADRYEPIFQRTFLEYSRYRGFIIDATDVASPKHKPKVERQIPYVRENFFKGEEFKDRDHAQREAIKWCLMRAGLRIHGTTRKRPRMVFEQQEKEALLPLLGERFDVPQWDPPHKVHPDHLIRLNHAGYSVPTEYIGKEVDVRVDSKLVRIYHKEKLIKTHPVKAPGERSIDYDDYPKEKTPYAMRNCEYHIQKAREIGKYCGRFTEKLLSGDFPWSKLRQAQKLIRLGEKYGSERVESACHRAIAFSLFNVYRVENIIKEATNSLPFPDNDSPAKEPAGALPGRFRRPIKYFKHPIYGGKR